MIENEIKERILKAVEEKREELIEFTRNLVKVRSELGEEGAAQKAVEKKLRDIGLEIDVFEADLAQIRKHPEYTPVEYSEKHGYKGRPNVVGKLKGVGGGRSMILTTHVDTVPVGPKDPWKHDPLGGEVDDGKLYGRGAACDKSGLALSILAVDSILAAGLRLKGDVTVASTIEDEVGGSGGILAFILRGYKADGALLPHPNLVGLGCMLLSSGGMLFFKVKVRGRNGEFPQGGVNAITELMKIYQALIGLDEYRGRTVRYEPYERFFSAAGWPPAAVRSTNIIPAIVSGGSDPIQVPTTCELQCSISFPPYEKAEAVKKIVEEHIKKAADSDHWLSENPPEIEWFGVKATPSVVDSNHPLAKMTQHYIEEIAGVKPFIGGIPMHCDFRYPAIYANTPQIMFGPFGDRLHGVDEYVDIESLVTATKITALIIADWCGYERVPVS